MNRIQLQQLARDRVRDAEVLLNAGQWSGAYYLSGYAVECALRACFARLTNLHDFPDRDLVVKSYTHNSDTLLEIAGLRGPRDADLATNAARRANWLIVRDWNERARYQQWTESQARALFAAVTDTVNGVLPWIESHW